ncbi:hypothetical protein [Serratia proteamaculans]|uniref:hypothetical protein n=1 Tax=Serratia proteamaculans TaxID=28151 RepID=UPI00217A3B75|nr:hypothetical protein [Serratia proteamaculans]CAI1546475.1 Uncharacterised protein [Serratia proteamaculans]
MNNCPDISTLRTLVPAAVGELIEVTSYYSNWNAPVTLPDGGGLFSAVQSSTLTDDGGMYIKSTGNWVWVRVLDVSGTVTPAMYGARGDNLADDTLPLTTCFLSPYAVICRAGATYLTSDTVRIKDGRTSRKTINLNGATIKAKAGHVKPMFANETSTSEAYDFLHGVEMFGGKLMGVANRDSVYNSVKSHVGYSGADGSYFHHMQLSGFNDGFSLQGRSMAHDIIVDECRDDFFATYNDSNVISDVICGYCLGDGFLVKGNNNNVTNIRMQGAGIPSDKPEAGYLSGAVLSVAQDKDMGSNNYISNIQCGQWGSGIAILSGSNNTCINIQAGDCYFLNNPTSSAIKNRACAVYVSGKGQVVRNVTAGACLSGVELHDGSEDNLIDGVSLRSCFHSFALTASGQQSRCRIGRLDIGKVDSADSIYIRMPQLVIDEINVLEYSAAYTAGSAICRILEPCSIRRLSFAHGLPEGVLPIVLLAADCDIDELIIKETKAVCLVTTATTIKVPRNLTIEQSSEAIDSPVKLLGAGQSVAGNWSIKGKNSVLPALRGPDVHLTLGQYNGLPWYIDTPLSSDIRISKPVGGNYSKAITAVAQGGFTLKTGSGQATAAELALAWDGARIHVALDGQDIGFLTPQNYI